MNSEAVLHVNDDGVTLYANQQMLKQLGQLLIALSETPKDEHYDPFSLNVLFKHKHV